MQMALPSVFCRWGMLQLFILCNFATSFDNSAYYDGHPVVYTYDRLSEIEKECSPYLSSASELKPDDSRSYRLKNELSFFNGDWVQEVSGAPLMPFDDSDIPRNNFSLSSFLKLVGFEVKDVNPIHQLPNAVSLCGTMCIGISRNSTLLYDAYSTFHMSPGMSVLKIAYQGVYIETMENGGKRLLCMLGNTTLPYGKWSDGPSYMESNFNTLSNLHHKLLQDDRILLVLRYPQHFSLTKRAILGELRSLNQQGHAKYFDVIHIFSQLGRYSKYEFSSEELKSRACDLSLYEDELAEDSANSFNSSEFCNALRYFSGEQFTIVPNWRFIGRYDYSHRLGPFLLGQEIDTEDTSHENVRLIIQNLICEQETTQNKTRKARVAAVFRAFPAEMHRSTAAARTALSSVTLSVEGTWEASKGQLCMAGCLGVVDAGLEGCDSQISLYFPRSLSIKQRSTILGSISSIKNQSKSYIPIIFELEIRPSDIYYNFQLYSDSYLSYNYSKIELARAFGKRSQVADLITAVKQLVMTYPALGDEKDLLARLDPPSRDLSISAHGIPVSSCHSDNPETFIQLEVLSLGPLLGGYAHWLHRNSPSVENQVEISKSEPLNVSLSLMFTEEPLIFTEKYYKNISKLFLEGLYDPLTGEMNLVGCRKIRVKSVKSNIERGLDCLIQVKIGYPTRTMRWLINPTAKVTITSQRNEDDALYFHPIKLRTSMLSYNAYEQDGVFRKAFEEILRNLMLIASIAMIFSQLIYIKENVDSIPYISRVMLSLQCIGYVLPLIRNTKILFPEKEYKGPDNLYGYEQILNILDFTGKVLVLIAFLLIATLSRKVSFFKKPHPHLPSKSRVVPNDKQVFLATAAIHVLLFLGYYHLYGNLFQNVITSTVEDYQKREIWMYKEEKHIGFIQDLFLLPQIIGNIFWQTHVRSLRKLYYIGFSLMRILILLYDCIRDPVESPYSDETAFLNLNSIPVELNIAVAVIISVLAAVVYIQQKENH